MFDDTCILTYSCNYDYFYFDLWKFLKMLSSILVLQISSGCIEKAVKSSIVPSMSYHQRKYWKMELMIIKLLEKIKQVAHSNSFLSACFPKQMIILTTKVDYVFLFFHNPRRLSALKFPSPIRKIELFVWMWN